jgi:hypothetical protein
MPNSNANVAIMVAPMKYGLKNLEKEIPELKKATISVLLANFEVNHITDKNKNKGKSKFAK